MFPFKKILCPTDFSEASLGALRAANEMAAQFGSKIVLVHVHKPIPSLPTPRAKASEIDFDITEYETQVAQDAKHNLGRVADAELNDGTDVQIIVRMGKRAANEILAVAEEEKVDVIFIATRGHTEIHDLIFGSVARRVVRRAHCPVLIIRD